LMICGHCTHSDMRTVLTHVTEVCEYWLCLRRRAVHVQYSGGCPSGRVFHRRCTHNH
jgi:hypothetical protein